MKDYKYEYKLLTEKDRCSSVSPIYKFDEGPRQCRLKIGHEGDHEARTSDGRYIRDPQCDYWVKWHNGESS